MATKDKISREIMVRALDLQCAKKLNALARELGTTKNQIVRRLLNEVTKNDQLIGELFAGDGTESQLRRFTNLLPALAWGDNAFQKRQSLEVLDFYSAILGDSSYEVFPGVLQIARYRCGFASLDVAIDYESRGILLQDAAFLSLSDRFICLGLVFFRQYGTHCEVMNKSWHEGMSHYNLACGLAQRSRLSVYKAMLRQVHQFTATDDRDKETNLDHQKLWSPKGPLRNWRESVDQATIKLVNDCKDEAFRELRRMTFTRTSHLASWIAETESDPDLVILKSDQEFSKEFKTWVSNAKRDLDVAGNIDASSRKLIESIEVRQPEIVGLLKEEEDRAK